MIKGYRKCVSALLLLLAMGFFSAAHGQSVLEVLKSNGQTSDFAAAIERAGLDDRLDRNKGSFTVFAPSNSAFNRISASEQNNSQLLLNHIITGKATKRSLQYMSKITCLSGLTVEVAQLNNSGLSIENYPLMESNIQADNGVIHVIDGVIQ
ncbi:fasciclin domain-containing protein [Fodinibius sediminis]|uniref:Uncaracterized surface protein containing fasciclin (FAS1) repeats n=1 Tax=Fodinibius sediminis TaxID=1214077 RepID=A0A521DB90_9BACT|nr:fasciclin domain-containing protein [Fodinibius sediminis]SMO68989.1 Uncaracterized surface protein containing fasciclin (FAS1) repeats [Fodinibius sediminis]